MHRHRPHVSCIAICLVAMLALPSALHGQITLTAADLLAAMKTGTRCTGYNTPGSQKVAVHVGVASTAAQSWDFRSLPFSKSADYEIIDPAAAPEHTLFPDANVVQSGTSVFQPGVVFYQYNQITQTEYRLHAVGYSGGAATYTYNPPAVQMRFPCTLGSSWTHVADPITPAAGITMQSTYKWACDAHGTLRLPNGDFPALRLLVETVTVSETPVGRSMLRSLHYNFVTKTMAGAPVTIDSTDEGLADVMASTGYVDPSGTSSSETVPSPDAPLVLGSVRPHPVTSEGIIPVTMARAGHLRLNLVDMLGREVALLAEGAYSAGTHAIRWSNPSLPSGRYLCIARSAEGFAAQPLTIIR